MVHKITIHCMFSRPTDCIIPCDLVFSLEEKMEEKMDQVLAKMEALENGKESFFNHDGSDGAGESADDDSKERKLVERMSSLEEKMDQVLALFKKH